MINLDNTWSWSLLCFIPFLFCNAIDWNSTNSTSHEITKLDLDQFRLKVGWNDQRSQEAIKDGWLHPSAVFKTSRGHLWARIAASQHESPSQVSHWNLFSLPRADDIGQNFWLKTHHYLITLDTSRSPNPKSTIEVFFHCLTQATLVKTITVMLHLHFDAADWKTRCYYLKHFLVDLFYWRGLQSSTTWFRNCFISSQEWTTY